MTYGTYCRLGVHVSASWRDVVRATRRKIAKRYQRKAMYRAMLAQHGAARDLYRGVVTGSLDHG